ncbi:MAG: rRNA maturation RNase YbeY [bacterium]|nr:rRNA maturation RNase YbeY [bacterium]
MIDVINLHEKYRVNKRAIRKAVRKTFLIEKKKYDQICVVLVNDDRIKQIHLQYMNDNSATDVITFDLTWYAQRISGDIFISLDTAKINAKEFQVTLLNEVLRLAIHGALHLCGYKDNYAVLRKIMSDRENQILNELLEIK